MLLLFLTWDVRRSWVFDGEGWLTLAQIPDESTLSAAARRVFHRAEPGKGLIGPGGVPTRHPINEAALKAPWGPT